MEIKDRLQLLLHYQSVLGRAVMEWNALHEAMGQLFSVIIYPGPAFPRIPMAIWHSSNVDRSQREMLRAAADARFTETEKDNPRAKEDIRWLINQTDILSNKRNDFVHGPVVLETNVDENHTRLRGDDFFGHQRAKNLNSNKDLLEFLDWASQTTLELKMFTMRMWGRFALPESSQWPDRPLLPTRTQKT